jgi:ABC-type multidrug transport system fused ATPase/permease subunit
MPTFLSSSIGYLARLLRFCLARHPVLLANTALAALSVLIELAALASVLPLSLIAAGEKIDPGSPWGRVFGALGAAPTFANAMLLFVGLFTLRLLTQFLNQAVAVRIAKQVQAELGTRAFSAIVNDLSLREIDAKSSGHFMSLAGDEAARAGHLVVVLNQITAATFLAAVYLAAVFAFSWRFGATVTGFLVIVLLGLQGTLRKIQTLGERQALESRVVNSVFLDALTGLRSVRALSAEAFVTAKYEDLLRGYTTTSLYIDVLRSGAKLIPALILLVCLAAAAAGGRLPVATPAELALVMTALAFVLRFFPTAGEVLTTFMFLLAYLRGASDVTGLADTPPAVQQPGAAALRDAVEAIELREVDFAYSAGKPVIERFSAVLRKGRSYAVVGASGSGKTTFFDLLLGFYAPDSGEVLVNGIPVPLLQSRSLRSRVALVGQQVAIFNDSIGNNVRFGAVADEVALREACQIACVDEFVRTLPDLYQTRLAFQGSNLSGGQRQRIGIARALLRNADVLLLDESTAGLDAGTRDRVVKNVLRLYRNRIVVFATHDREIASRVDEVISLAPRAAASEAAA